MVVKKAFKYRTLYIDNDIRVEYNGGRLYFVSAGSKGDTWKCCVETSFLMQFFAMVPICSRFLRCEPRCILRWSEKEFLVSHRGGLYKIDLQKKKCEILFRYSKGTNNPLYFCQFERKGERKIVFGDYGGHDENGRVGIYSYTNNGLKEIASFAREEIDHIHRVEYDQYRDCYWIFTGDTDERSGIWYMDYDEKKIMPYLVGKQKYRACVAFIEQNRMVYATDTPLEKNNIYSIRFDNKVVEELCNIPGPCIYGTRVRSNDRDAYCFSTSVEPDSSLPTWLYRITYRLGTGVRDKFSYVLIGNIEEGIGIVWKSRKDALPMWMFQFGNHRFPVQNVEGKVYFCAQSCKKTKGTLVCDL